MHDIEYSLIKEEHYPPEDLRSITPRSTLGMDRDLNTLVNKLLDLDIEYVDHGTWQNRKIEDGQEKETEYFIIKHFMTPDVAYSQAKKLQGCKIKSVIKEKIAQADSRNAVLKAALETIDNEEKTNVL